MGHKTRGKSDQAYYFERWIILAGCFICAENYKRLVEVPRKIEREPALGFIYGAMDTAKDQIAKNLRGDEGKYKPIWKIIDDSWSAQMHSDLHVVAYYLNP
ncbi:hypothetical protein Syun_014337 [Stephania yunnanensis]|uniref:Uncharacterized protein n=1 Tax=Stephania yunnanensis TaxID=152371 RepID=A0AAP0P8N2_9MAGN